MERDSEVCVCVGGGGRRHCNNWIIMDGSVIYLECWCWGQIGDAAFKLGDPINRYAWE